MDCPVCKEAMVTFELEQVEVDCCLECNGVWLDAGELEMLLGDRSEASRLLDSFKDQPRSRERARKCPICLKRMRKIVVGDVPGGVLIDKCKRGHGLWFDKGELQGILKSASLGEESKVQKLLADMFGAEHDS